MTVVLGQRSYLKKIENNKREFSKFYVMNVGRWLSPAEQSVDTR